MNFEKEYQRIVKQTESDQILITALVTTIIFIALLASCQLGLYLKELKIKEDKIVELNIENEDLKEQIYMIKVKGEN